MLLLAGQCPALPSPENGIVTNQRFHGATATYSCGPEYQLDPTSGDATRTCQDGTWSGSAPACVGTLTDEN